MKNKIIEEIEKQEKFCDKKQPDVFFSNNQINKNIHEKKARYGLVKFNKAEDALIEVLKMRILNRTDGITKCGADYSIG